MPPKPPPPLTPPSALWHRRGCFITGTDTGVGKTAVTAALARCLRARRLSVGVMKPVETGIGADVRSESDAERLLAAAGASIPLSTAAPYRFADPLAPLAAARRAGRTIEMAPIVAAFTQLAARYPLILVEGAGGLLAPLSERFDMGDLMAALGLPAVIVGRTALGGVNHVLLTIEALARRKVPILAVILNRPTSEATSAMNPSPLQEQSTVELVRELAGLPVLGPLRHVATLDTAWQTGVLGLSTDPAIQALADLTASSAG